MEKMEKMITITNGTISENIPRNLAFQSEYIKNNVFDNKIEIKASNEELKFLVKVLERRVKIIEKQSINFLSLFSIEYPKEINERQKQYSFFKNTTDIPHFNKIIKSDVPYCNGYSKQELIFNLDKTCDLYSKIRLYYDIPHTVSKYDCIRLLRFMYGDNGIDIVDNKDTIKSMGKNGIIKIEKKFSYFITGNLYYRYKLLIPLWFSKNIDYQELYYKDCKKMDRKRPDRILNNFLYMRHIQFVDVSIHIIVDNSIETGIKVNKLYCSKIIPKYTFKVNTPEYYIKRFELSSPRNCLDIPKNCSEIYPITVNATNKKGENIQFNRIVINDNYSLSFNGNYCKKIIIPFDYRRNNLFIMEFRDDVKGYIDILCVINKVLIHRDGRICDISL